MSFDASDLRALGREMGEVHRKAAPQLGSTVSKAALNIKNQLRREARGSDHFGQIASTIDYDRKTSGGVIEAEIGPNKDVGGSASLAGIAYFGTSRPGGGTLPDPVGALEAEAPRLEQSISDILGKSFG